MSEKTIENWLSEFGEEYRPDDEILNFAKESGIEDASWHNDVFPHLVSFPNEDGESIELWFGRKNEEGNLLSYQVCRRSADGGDVDCLTETDMPNVAIFAFREIQSLYQESN